MVVADVIRSEGDGISLSIGRLAVSKRMWMRRNERDVHSRMNYPPISRPIQDDRKE